MTGRRGRKLKSGQPRRVVQAKLPMPIYLTVAEEAARRGVPLCDFGAVMTLKGLNQNRVHVGLPPVTIPNYLRPAVQLSVPLFRADPVHPGLDLPPKRWGERASAERKAVQAKLPPYLFELVVEEAADRGLSLCDHGALLILQGFNEERARASLPVVPLPEYLRDLASAPRAEQRQECLMAG